MGEVWVLEAVVHHQHVGPCSNSKARGVDAVRADPCGCNACEQHGFVADLAGTVVGIDAQWSLGAAAVATGENMRVATMRLEVADDSERRWGLTRTTHRDVTQTNHRHRRAGWVGGGAAHLAGEAVEGAERAEEGGQPKMAGGPKGGCTH